MSSDSYLVKETMILLPSKTYRGEKMSTRSYDHCTCGHKRENHDNFEGNCKECNCGVFHRGIHMQNLVID
jgi:hypothetical protein